MPYSNTAASRTATREGLVAVDGRTFPLRSAEIKARAQGGLAFTTLRQEFANPHAEPLEVLYTMPLPADGAVVGYTFRLGERVARGEIETRERAQEDYRRALMEGRTAGLLEQERADTFAQSLGNLPPGAAVTVEIQLLHPLLFLPGISGGTASWEWRFPTVVSVRYGGGPDVDASRAEPCEDGIPARLSAELVVGDGVPMTVAPQRLDRDLVFSWAATSADIEARLVEGPGLPGDDGRYAMVVVTPPSAPAAVRPRDLTILLDASGSMDGQPLEKAKAVVKAVLDSLREADRFEVLAFSNTVWTLAAAGHASGRTVAKARRRLAELSADGGTEMTRAVLEALAREPRRDAQRQIVLITDGCVGFEREVAAAVRNRMPEASRMHVVGIGAAPNRALTRAAARAGRGLELLVGLADDPAVAAARLVRGTVAPVLTEVTVSGSGYVGFAPEKSRDVFAGEPLSILVHVVPGGGTLEVTGRLAGENEPWRRRFEVGGRAVVDGAVLPLGAAYARERVEDIESRERPDDKAIEALGLKHRIVTRRTSLVAISEEPTVDPRDPRRRVRLPVELPFGVSAEGVGLVLGLGRRRQAIEFGLSALVEEEVLSLDDGEFGELESRALGSTSGRLRDTVDARIVARAGRKLVLELEAPEEGFEVPEAGTTFHVAFDRGTIENAHLVPEESTRTGWYPGGLTVRLTLVFDHDVEEKAPISLGWIEEGDMITVRFV